MDSSKPHWQGSIIESHLLVNSQTSLYCEYKELQMLVYNSYQCFICHVQLCSEIHFAYSTYTGTAMFWRHYSTHARCTGEVPMN